MIIETSQVAQSTKASYKSVASSSKTVTYTPAIRLGSITLTQGADNETGDFLSSLNYSLNKNGQVQEVDNTAPLSSASANSKVRMQTMTYLLYMLLYGRLLGNNTSLADILSDAFQGATTYNCQTYTSGSYEESQEVTYEATGAVVTADGRELSFNYSLSMSSSFKEAYEEYSSQIIPAEMVDPLVINLDNNPARISDQKFYFDLDCDGQNEYISSLSRGSGFLALDKNGDGTINDGSELFGALSGDGFAELAAYDEDGNGWIDENDSIFSQLRIWTQDENGQAELYGLKESDVGAICLAKMKTGFTLYDDDHNMEAAVRSTGLYLHESTGAAGTVQHVDFAT